MPDFVLTNAMLEQMVDTNDEWIVQRTGVRERRIAKNTHTWELALGAAQDALADAGITAEELDLILVSTCYAGYQHAEHGVHPAGQAGRASGRRVRYQQRLHRLRLRDRHRGQLHQVRQGKDRTRRLGGNAFAHRGLHRPLDLHSVRRRCGCGRLSARPRTKRSAFSPPSSRRTARARNTCTWRPCRSRTRFRGGPHGRSRRRVS